MAATGPHRIAASPLNLDKGSEDMAADDSSMTGSEPLIVGKQTQTRGRLPLDLPGAGSQGQEHVLGPKRARTSRDPVAPVLDCGSWAHRPSDARRPSTAGASAPAAAGVIGNRFATSSQQHACLCMSAQPTSLRR